MTRDGAVVGDGMVATAVHVKLGDLPRHQEVFMLEGAEEPKPTQESEHP
jgi:hypothetical protein